MNIGIISLGCDKNRCNTETMLAYLDLEKYQLVNELDKADIVVVNTCAFILSAREESINTILEVAELKKTGRVKKIIVTGCLPQKYIDELYDELVEVDAFLGTKDYPLIAKTIEDCMNERVNNVGKCSEVQKVERYLTTPTHYAYLMIADGCNNHCTYCTIPQIRGKYISKKMEDVLIEANELVQSGVKELILVAQDVTNYGSDLYGEIKLVELLQKLTKIDDLKYVRLLYCYPEKVDAALIEEVKNNPKILKYMDIPLQHASTATLKRMGRAGTNESYRTLFETLKKKIPELAIRSTVMVGFPGETEEEFSDLVAFLKDTKPINCGVFMYSDEDDATSRLLPNKVSEDTKFRRYERLMDILMEISTDEKEKLVGKELEVVYEGIDFDRDLFVGRSYISAPDIDSLVYFKSSELVEVGNYYKIQIERIEYDDLEGVLK